MCVGKERACAKREGVQDDALGNEYSVVREISHCRRRCCPFFGKRSVRGKFHLKNGERATADAILRVLR